jgi:hypothetical protein
MKILIFVTVICFSLSSYNVEGQTNNSTATRNKANYLNCKKIFNGRNFDGWIADSSTWTVVDGAMRGYGGSSRLAYTKKSYGSFRLIFTGRMNPKNNDHLGVLFWGNRPENSVSPMIDLAGWIQFIPPQGIMWDYHPPHHRYLESEEIVKGNEGFNLWSTTEILCNIAKGTMRGLQ